MATIISIVASALAQIRSMAAEMAGILSSAISMANQAAALRNNMAGVQTVVTTVTSPWPRSSLTGDLLDAWIDAMRQMNPNLAGAPYPYQTRLGEFKEVEETGPGIVHKGEIIGRPTGTSSVTVPVTVQLDGATIAKAVEKRLVQQQSVYGAYGI
jgi:hypothetical protein